MGYVIVAPEDNEIHYLIKVFQRRKCFNGAGGQTHPKHG